ncbi:MULTISPECIES: VMAP-C domain-containing protein [unclassified Microcoleus]|uniref:VMAP-C domain-containing protein n=1 Tax=unclassified Microcoleus TaxID=2642155 RepID=UPI002FD25B49
MTNPDELSSIIDRITTAKQTDEDIAILQQLLSLNDRQLSIQLGKYNVNITEGKEIHIGDRIYQQWDKEAMEALVKTIQETSGIHQNTQGGDAAGRDIDKRNVYENCIFIQLVAKDSNFDSFSQESFQDLDFSGIPSESIQKAYQDSLPPDADVWDLPPPNADVSDLAGNNIATVLKKLNEFRQLSQFFERLSQDQNVPVEIRDRIANKFPSKKYPEKGKNKSSTDFFYNQLGPLKSYLIATLVPDDPDDEKFLLNAWLIMDDSVQNLSKFQSLLDQNEQQAGKLCKLTQIPTELNNFLEKALRYLIGRKYNLTIEIFLPCHLMCMEIDRWKITDPIVDDITLGIKYPVRLRLLERLNLKYLYSYLSQWYQSWDKVREILQNEPTQENFEHLQEIESFNCKLLSRKLKEKIGLKVTCTHSKSIRKDLFNAILIATTPIAIWTRADIANLDQVTAINDILTFKPLCNLSESVRHHREEADNAQTDEHLGHHLALLWENPYRLTPDIMVELNSPGQ